MSEHEDDVFDYARMLRLDGRHVLVMGGGQGIGRQACRALAAVGARVTVLDLEQDRAQEVADEVSGLAFAADVTSTASLEEAFAAAVAHHGPLDGLVDVVGGTSWSPIAETDDEAFRRTVDLNLGQAFRGLRLLCRHAAEHGASAVFVSSISGIRSAPQHAAYGAAKAGLNNLIGSAAVELGPRIRVNAVAPGLTRTARLSARHADDNFFEAAAEQVPLGRVGETQDIASALLYFVSDLSSWITGQVLVVDGGAGRRYQYDITS